MTSKGVAVSYWNLKNVTKSIAFCNNAKIRTIYI